MARAFAYSIDFCSLTNRRLLKAKIMEYMVKGFARHVGVIFVVVELSSFGRLVPSAIISWVILTGFLGRKALHMSMLCDGSELQIKTWVFLADPSKAFYANVRQIIDI